MTYQYLEYLDQRITELVNKVDKQQNLIKELQVQTAKDKERLTTRIENVRRKANLIDERLKKRAADASTSGKLQEQHKKADK